MSYTETSTKQRLTLGDSKNALTRLIVINLVVFITIALSKVFYYYLYRTEEDVNRFFYGRCAAPGCALI